MRLFSWVLFSVLFLIFQEGLIRQIYGQTTAGKKLIIATKEAAPFSIKSPDGTWSGISIELWEQIALENGYQYELREMTLDEMVSSLEKGTVDAGVAALTITSEREEEFDFTHAFYTTGLSVAVTRDSRESVWSILSRFFSWDFFKAAATLAFVILIFGVLVWLFERRKNPEHFGGNPLRGIGAGFWWSAVTMTTVGYGDKSPVTFPGRFLGFIWMFMAIIIISSFTASIATALTVNQLQANIGGPEDLHRVKVGTVKGSTSEEYLQMKRITYFEYTTVIEGLEALATEEIKAMVYDSPILRYRVNTEFRDWLEVLPFTFSRQDYGIALPAGSHLREPINQQMLQKIRQAEWEDVLYRYLGAE